MMMSLPRCIKFEFSLKHKTVFNCVMLYPPALMMTSFKFSEDLANNQINLWLEYNLMTLNKTMVEVWNKKAIELGYKKV